MGSGGRQLQQLVSRERHSKGVRGHLGHDSVHPRAERPQTREGAWRSVDKARAVRHGTGLASTVGGIAWDAQEASHVKWFHPNIAATTTGSPALATLQKYLASVRACRLLRTVVQLTGPQSKGHKWPPLMVERLLAGHVWATDGPQEMLKIASDHHPSRISGPMTRAEEVGLESLDCCMGHERLT